MIASTPLRLGFLLLFDGVCLTTLLAQSAPPSHPIKIPHCVALCPTPGSQVLRYTAGYNLLVTSGILNKQPQ